MTGSGVVNWRRLGWPRLPHAWALFAIIAAAYAAGAELSSLGFSSGFPSAGVTVAAMLLVRAAVGHADGVWLGIVTSDRKRLERITAYGPAGRTPQAPQYVPVEAPMPAAEVLRTGQPLLVMTVQEPRTCRSYATPPARWLWLAISLTEFFVN